MNKYETGYGVNFAEEATYVDKSSYKHSYRDYGMFPKSKMVVQPPSVRETYVEIAGADGDLDLSEVLTGAPTYDSRDAQFSFLLTDRKKWDAAYTALMNEVHGKRMRVVIDEDSNYYYTGRVKVNSFASNKNTATIVVDGHFDPYKKSMIANSERWLWDPFCFETDIARDYDELVVSGATDFTIVGSRLPVTPAFVVSSSMTLTFDGNTYTLEPGAARSVPTIVLRDKEYTMRFTGNGTVSIKFEVGSL